MNNTDTPKPLSALCDRLEALARKADAEIAKGAKAGGSARKAAYAVAAMHHTLDPWLILRLVAAVRAGEKLAAYTNHRRTCAGWISPDDFCCDCGYGPALAAWRAAGGGE